MAGDAFVWLAAAGAVGGVALLRIGWARPRRSAGGSATPSRAERKSDG
jgi:hypothetical protein